MIREGNNTEASLDFETLPIAGLEELWAETAGDKAIAVAILDGPVERSHLSLAAADLTQLETLVSAATGQGPSLQHGTHVASIIFGQHEGPVRGIAPRCRGLILPIFKDGDDGEIAPCSQLDMARAITQAVKAGAHVINISGGELSPSGTAHPLLADAVQSCVDNNVLLIAAAGNEGCECLHVPGALPSVLAVGAMDAQGRPLEFSNWGKEYQYQGVVALGENVPGALPGGGVTTQSGTSYAAAITSGIAALLLSLQIKLGQKPDPQRVRASILESAYSCTLPAMADCQPFMVGSLNVSGARTIINAAGQAVLATGLSQQAHAKQGQQEMLEAGDTAPDFSLKDHRGRDVHLSDYQGQTVVLWFYPQADTPG